MNQHIPHMIATLHDQVIRELLALCDCEAHDDRLHHDLHCAWLAEQVPEVWIVEAWMSDE